MDFFTPIVDDPSTFGRIAVTNALSTDITGLGLLGHAMEMIEGAETGMKIYSGAIPYFKGIQELVEMGIVPGGLYNIYLFFYALADALILYRKANIEG